MKRSFCFARWLDDPFSSDDDSIESIPKVARTASTSQCKRTTSTISRQQSFCILASSENNLVFAPKFADATADSHQDEAAVVSDTIGDTLAEDTFPSAASPQQSLSVDDGNTDAGDGCSSDCTSIGAGFTCDGAPSNCQAVCGDALIVSGEACDDGNAAGSLKAVELSSPEAASQKPSGAVVSATRLLPPVFLNLQDCLRRAPIRSDDLLSGRFERQGRFKSSKYDCVKWDVFEPNPRQLDNIAEAVWKLLSWNKNDYIGMSLDLLWRWTQCQGHGSMQSHLKSGFSEIWAITQGDGKYIQELEKLLIERSFQFIPSRVRNARIYRSGPVKPERLYFLYVATAEFM